MTLRVRLLGTCLAIVAGAGQAGAAPYGDADTGKRLAELWCSSCHLVSSEQTRATTEAPPFATIAAHSPEPLSWIGPFLADPHPPMPQFSLTRDEIRDLAAYIASLKPKN